MKNYTPFYAGMVLLGVLLASCGSIQPTSQVRDDVYFMPSEAPISASNGTTSKAGQPEPRPDNPQQMEVVEDYFDAGTAQQMGSSRGYYDMAYNDPYYYNYGRFGFGSAAGMGGMSMGYMSGWNSPGWSMSLGWGSSYGWGPSYGGYGQMGWGSSYGWYDPWDPWGRWNRWNNPYWMGMGYNPWNSGYGYGPYWGPYGYSTNCYAPVVIGGSSNVHIGHRSSLGSGGNSSTGGSGTRGGRPHGQALRDPVSLDPVRRDAAAPRYSGSQEQNRSIQQRPAYPSSTPRSINRGEAAPTTRPQQDSSQQPRTAPTRQAPERTSPTRTAPRGSSPSRNFDQQQRSGGSDINNSPSRSPSNSGTRPSGTPRPR